MARLGVTTVAYLRARLERDRPDLSEAVEHGEMSVRTAARAAGIINPPSGLMMLRRAWRKASPSEREAFLQEFGLRDE